jgi:hypothetical protein
MLLTRRSKLLAKSFKTLDTGLQRGDLPLLAAQDVGVSERMAERVSDPS